MIQRHPKLHFIECGTEQDLADEQGITLEVLNGGLMPPDEWWARMDGRYIGRSSCLTSFEEACLAAESYLFDPVRHDLPWDLEVIEDRVQALVVAGDVQAAINLAELRGLWAGRSQVSADMQSRFAEFQRATAALMPFRTERCTLAGQRSVT
jgi:hypothetical protein